MLNYKTLPSLHTVDLIAPGSPVSVRQIQQAIQMVESLGFKARVCVSKREGSTLFSGTDHSRFQCLQKALTALDSEAVWCIRGGYGSQRLMPFLRKMSVPVRPKLFIGYSDVTVLKIFLNSKWKWPTLHFPVLIHLAKASKACVRRFQAVLQGHQQQFRYLQLLNPSVVRSSLVIQSYLTGGNMSLIQTSIGVPWACSFKDRILFLEDIGEKAYRVDRALWQMWKGGVFRGIKALVLGDFLSLEKGKSKVMNKVFQDFSEQVSFPVLKGVPCGHGKKTEVLPFMTDCKLFLSKNGWSRMSIHSPFQIRH